MVKALDRKLLRDLAQLKGQVLTVALVVACGISGFVAFRSTWASLRVSRDSYYERYRFGDAFVHLKRAPEAVAARLEDLPGVARVYTRVVQTISIPMAGQVQPPIGEIVSLPSGPPPLNQLFISRGRMPDPTRGDEALLLAAFADRYHLGPGDSLPAVINGTQRQLRIVGLATSPEFVYPLPPGAGLSSDDARFAVLWMDRTGIAPAFQMDGAFNDVVFRLQPDASERSVLADIDRVLDPYGGLPAVGRGRQPSNYVVIEEMEQLRAWATVVPAIFLSVSAFLVNVVLSRLVSLQRPEIATLKAMGYSDWSIGYHFIKLVSVFVLLGAILGVALGAVLGRGLTSIYTSVFHFPLFEYHVALPVVAAGTVVSLVAAVVGAAAAVRQVVRLTAAEAMRPPAPAVYRPLLTERLGLAGWTSQAGRMVLRELERRPLRLVLSALGVAAAIAILVVGRMSGDAINYVLDVQFERAWREDLAVSFRNLMPERSVRFLAELPGVRRAEGVRALGATVHVGARSRDVFVVGYQDDAQLRRVVNREGRPVPLPVDGALASAQLAKILGVAPGDTVLMKALEGERRTYPVRIAGLVTDLAGLQLYFRRPVLAALLGESPSINSAILAVDPSRQDEIERRLTALPQVATISSRASAIAYFRRQSAKSMVIISAVLTAFAATIAIGVIYNNARVALSLRSRELASLRVLGFTRTEISGVLLAELAVQVLVALPLGLLLSVWFTHWVVATSHPERFRLPDNVSAHRLAFAVLVTLVAAAVSALLVRRRLDRLDLVAVLKTRE
jgi:putative ABC transport system permease protein